jgi:hypothetical protein
VKVYHLVIIGRMIIFKIFYMMWDETGNVSSVAIVDYNFNYQEQKIKLKIDYEN